MGSHESNERRRRYRPPPAFWIKVGLALNLLAQLLPGWLALLLGMAVLFLPAWIFRG
jgi:hypothetical protein